MIILKLRFTDVVKNTSHSSSQVGQWLEIMGVVVQHNLEIWLKKAFHDCGPRHGVQKDSSTPVVNKILY